MDEPVAYGWRVWVVQAIEGELRLCAPFVGYLPGLGSLSVWQPGRAFCALHPLPQAIEKAGRALRLEPQEAVRTTRSQAPTPEP